MSAGLQMLLLDRELPTSHERLRRWLGPDDAAKALAGCPGRYIIVTTSETGAEPRYLHLVEYLPGIEDLIGCFACHMAVEEMLATPMPRPIDIAYSLTPAERARVDQMLDEREAERLMRAQTAGRA